MGWHLLSWFVLLLCAQNGGEPVWQRLGAKSCADPSQQKPKACLGKSQSRTGLLAFPEQHPESSKPEMWPDWEARDSCPISSCNCLLTTPWGCGHPG